MMDDGWPKGHFQKCQCVKGHFSRYRDAITVLCYAIGLAPPIPLLCDTSNLDALLKEICLLKKSSSVENEKRKAAESDL